MKYLPPVRSKLAHEFLAWINKVNRHKTESNPRSYKTSAQCIIDELGILVDVSCVFHNDYLTFYNRDWNSDSGTNFGIPCKCSIKLFRSWSQDRNTWNIKYEFDLAAGKYFIKTIFDIKMEISIFETSNVPNFNQFWVFLILGPIWA